MPQLHTEKLLNLAGTQRQDLAIALSTSLQFDVPHQILLESLSILLAADLETLVIKDLASLPPFGTTINVFFLQQLASSEKNAAVALEVGDGARSDYSTKSFDAQLWDSMPEVSAAFPAGGGAGTPEERRATSFRAKHAAIVFSRAPSFPPLMDKSAQVSLTNQKMYKKLLRLLEAAGMTESDLTTGAVQHSTV